MRLLRASGAHHDATARALSPSARSTVAPSSVCARWKNLSAWWKRNWRTTRNSTLQLDGLSLCEMFERQRIHTIAQPRGRRTIGKDVTQVAITASATHLG